MTSRIVLIGTATAAAELARLLDARVDVSAVDSAAAITHLRSELPDVAVLSMIDVDGPALLARLVADPALQTLPVLALVLAGDLAAIANALEAGAADCAVLPLATGDAVARVTALLRRKRQADRTAEEQRAVYRLATLDAVTGIYNRRYLDEQLRAALSIARMRSPFQPLSVLMLDIDAFKPVNDRHGHAAGDRALAVVAARLVANVRAIDTVARYGGDELAVVMPDTDLETARRVAERLRAAVAETPVAGLGGLWLTVSIGVAALCPADQDSHALLARADAALYVAKRAGRNRVAEAAAA